MCPFFGFVCERHTVIDINDSNHKNEEKKLEERISEAEKYNSSEEKTDIRGIDDKEQTDKVINNDYDADSIRLELEIREKELLKREKSAEEREARLSEAESEFSKKAFERECSIADQTKSLEKATERYIVERTLWEQTVNEIDNAHTDYASEFRNIGDKFIEVCRLINVAREELADTRNTVCNSFNNGVKELCNLYRNMCSSGELSVEKKANELAVVLQKEFGAVPFEPAPGTKYNSELHEKIDFNRNGDIIVCCKARGWKYKDNIILRAVVNTKEVDN